MPGCVVLLSGGLDSATALSIAKRTTDKDQKVHAVSFDYGQRHHVELKAAAEVAEFFKVDSHKVFRVDLGEIGGSALTDPSIPVPKDRSVAEMNAAIPTTFVPCRNLIFLSYALAYAEVQKVTRIVIGVNVLDYSGYPDCRPVFIEAFEKLAQLTSLYALSGGKIVIDAPLITLSKKDIIERGLANGVDFAMTSSCYDPAGDGKPCGTCDSCKLRAKGFAELGITDPRLLRFGE